MLINRESDAHLKFLHKEDKQSFLSQASFWVPQLINISAWIEHAPFAFWLVKAMAPKTIVELGTHTGYSYFAFCQAVQQANLPTRCYAIDTWMGDEHAGFYGNDVYEFVSGYNQQWYAGFSQLLRTSFDDALDYFLDGSIDILHIDGRHFYADVKHDFESWLSKLSQQGIVLFHDINVKERHFGVFKLWDELSQLYPHFEFVHGHGLGVLAVGQSIPANIHALFDASQEIEQAAFIRTAYSRLGGALIERDQFIKQRDEVNKLKQEKEKLQADLLLAIPKAHYQNEMNDLKSTVELQKQALAKLENERQRMHHDLLSKEKLSHQLQHQLSTIKAVSKEKDIAITYLNRVVNEIYMSKTWRFTLPFRKLKQLFSS